jgi:hypothetical protein
MTSRADVDPTISTRFVVPLRRALSLAVVDPAARETSAWTLTHRFPGLTGLLNQALRHASGSDPYRRIAVNASGYR